MSFSPFIPFAVDQGCLSFGDYTLKSGRQSPYFFNLGKLCQGKCLARLGQFYADKLCQHNLAFDVLFGPSYKGIPIAVSTAIALSHRNINIEVAFDRKETKKHGDGGQIVGANLQQKRIVIIDDVFTAGTAFRHAHQLVSHHGGKVVAAIIALDRQEKGRTSLGTVREISDEFKLPVLSIVNLDDLLLYLHENASQEHLHKLTQYREQWGE